MRRADRRLRARANEARTALAAVNDFPCPTLRASRALDEASPRPRCDRGTCR
ncbi:MAG: hypothetical protein H6722_04530 [Sandaracinus sp.]|nr:hypothetical protein [Sandaracinus sp.]